jgi:alkaline phosphatase
MSDIDNKPYATISYGNGPGFKFIFNADGTRANPLNYNLTNHKVQYPATAPMKKDTHGGQDVGVWASGPQAHLFSGHYEQNTIPMIMAHILQVGPYAVDEKCAACSMSATIFLICIPLTMTFKFLM